MIVAAKLEMPSLDDFHTLTYYTLAHPDRRYFIHQHAVDAFAAQEANAQSKPINVVFALVGLCLYLERGYTGRQVQEAHVYLSRDKRWPAITLPEARGLITVQTVLRTPEGNDRDEQIRKWCVSVWDAYAASQEAIRSFLTERLATFRPSER